VYVIALLSNDVQVVSFFLTGVLTGLEPRLAAIFLLIVLNDVKVFRFIRDQ
jgi:hypothetical protein